MRVEPMRTIDSSGGIRMKDDSGGAALDWDAAK